MGSVVEAARIIGVIITCHTEMGSSARALVISED